MEQKTDQMPAQNGNRGIVGPGHTLATSGCVIVSVVNNTSRPKRPLTSLRTQEDRMVFLMAMGGLLLFIGGAGLV